MKYHMADKLKCINKSHNVNGYVSQTPYILSSGGAGIPYYRHVLYCYLCRDMYERQPFTCLLLTLLTLLASSFIHLSLRCFFVYALFQIASKLCSTAHKFAVGELSQHTHRQNGIQQLVHSALSVFLQKVQKISRSYTQNEDYRRLGQSIQAVLSQCL